MPKLTGKAHPSSGIRALDFAGAEVPVVLDASVRPGELLLFDAAGTYIKTIRVGNEEAKPVKRGKK